MIIESTNERLIVCTTTHWVKYLFNALKNHLLVIIGICLILVSSLAILQTVSLITFGAGMLLTIYAHHNFFHKLMSESMFDIFVTNERIIYFDDNLFLCNNEHEIPLHRIASIEAKQEGLIPNLFNYGTLWVDTGGGSIDFKRSIPYVPKPEQLNEKIAQLVHTEHEHHKL